MIEYRRLSAADIDAVMEMNKSFREGFIEQSCAAAFLEDTRNWLFAAMEDGCVIGFAYGYALNRLDRKQKQLYIHEVGVREDRQRQGIGFAMMTALLRQCALENICKCFLTCYQNNAGANALYRKLHGEVPEESQGNDRVYYFPIRS